jgi:preprotein translocase subunit SecF
MRLIPLKPRIDFLGKRRYTVALSAILVAIGLVSILTRGIPLGLDFTGGLAIHVSYPSRVELNQVRHDLQQGGYGDAVVQYFGTASEVMIRMGPDTTGGGKASAVAHSVLTDLQKTNSKVQLQSVEFIGSKVSSQLFQKAGLAMLYALIGILIYVMFRFEWRFAVGSVIALVHDTIITLGFFSVFGLQFDLTVLAAILAMVGYSINDTIVIFDRIRENFRRLRKRNTEQIMNAAINETLSRTIITVSTVLIVLVVLLLLGSETIRGFAIALIVGSIVGTYSSIFIASTIALKLGVRRENFLPQEKKSEDDAMP